MLEGEISLQKDLLKEVYQSSPRLRKISFKELEEALEQGKLLYIEGLALPAFRFKRDWRGFSAGTVVAPGFLMPGFPHIPRIFVLYTGVPRYLRGPFYAEEKIEGYNVRLARLGGEIKAFTRRGFVCPFATDRWPDFLPRLPDFFDKFPQYVVCCEVAGPENPFVTEWPPYLKEDVGFFCFDILDLAHERFLPPEEKYALFKEFGFPMPEVNGPFSPNKLKTLKEILLRYETEGREGVVLKPISPQSGRVIKYVTAVSNISDLRVAFPYIGELDPNYIVHRLVRMVITRWELGEGFGDDFYRQVGEALFTEMPMILDQIAKGKPVEEVFQVRLRREESLEALLSHFRLAQVRVEVRQKKWQKGYLRVKFAKIYPRATSFWASKLEGLAQID